MRVQRYFHRVYGVLLLCVAMGWGGVESSTEEKGSEVFAVLIGVNKYRSSSITALKYTERDVRGLYGVLTKEGGVPRKNVRMLLNERATKKAIRESLKVWLKEKVRGVGKRAKVVVYFSGHGYAQSGTSYWLPYDARVEDAQSVEDTGISSDHVNAWLSLRSLGSRSVVVLVDACHSGFAWSGTRTLQKTLRKKLAKGFKSGVGGIGFGEGHAVIASSMQDQFSVEVEALQHGVFSYALMEALRGKADFNRDGKVTLPELWAYLSYRVKELAKKYKRYPQVPVKSGPEAGEMVLSFPKVSAKQESARREASGSTEGILVLSSNVDGVKVYVDGRYRAYLRKGMSKRLKLSSGKHTVVFQKSGYVEKKEEVELEGGEELPLESNLSKVEARRAEQPRDPVQAVEVPSKVEARRAEQPRVPVQAVEVPSGGSEESRRKKEPAAGARKTFTAGGVGFAMRWIPAGSFMMGTPSDASWRSSDESPQRRVEISKGFWMLETEVTQGQYKALMGKNPSQFKKCGDNCPVEVVSWHDARAFANKLSQAEGLSACTAMDRRIFRCKGWRLPTEAEWEYAARAGTTKAHYGALWEVAWYFGNGSGDTTHPVGRKKANAWGLHDMLGNVSEWVMDVKGSYAELGTRDPLCTSGDTHSGLRRVIRGGGWASVILYLSSRGCFAPSEYTTDLGFRLLRYSKVEARSAEQPRTPARSVEDPLGGSEESRRKREPAAGARKTFTAGGVGFAMRWIPSGSFLMGSPPNEAGRSENEGPQRRVEISKGFWMLESEVTQGQYKALVGSNPSVFSLCGDTCPVEQVNWNDARKFADKLSGVEGLSACTATDRDIFGCKGWRLPTEAEWEYAARAGTSTIYHTGDCLSTGQANFNGHELQKGCGKGEYRRKPIAACRLARNQWGLCDMHGNVWEWTMDVYKNSYAGLTTRDPLRASGGMWRVFRGGGWNNNAWDIRSAERRMNESMLRSNVVGFRLVRY